MAAYQDNKGQGLKATIYSNLAGLARTEGSGLERDSQEKLKKRLLALEPTDSGWQISIGSDGLNLDHKLTIERHLLSYLGKEHPRATFSIYFKRQQPAAHRTGSEGPVTVDHGNNPLSRTKHKRPIPGVQYVISVASGKGGVGKSTVSINLAVALAVRGLKVGLLDADIYGPSAPMMLGIRATPSVNATGKLIPPERYGVRLMSFGFLSDALHPVIWRGPLAGKAIEQFCYDVAWGELDILVVDLPPGTGDVQLSLTGCLPLEGALIVTTPQDVALIDAHKALSMFETLGVRVLGLVENMSVYGCPACGHKSHIFGNQDGVGEFSSLRRIKKLVSIPLDPSVPTACDRGQPIGICKGHPGASLFQDLADTVIKGTVSKAAVH